MGPARRRASRSLPTISDHPSPPTDAIALTHRFGKTTRSPGLGDKTDANAVKFRELADVRRASSAGSGAGEFAARTSLPGSDGDRRVDPLQGEPGDHLVASGAEDDPGSRDHHRRGAARCDGRE